MSFGENLKKFREEKQLGVNQLALKSGVSAAQISRFENGKRKTPHVDTAKKLAKALSSNQRYDRGRNHGYLRIYRFC